MDSKIKFDTPDLAQKEFDEKFTPGVHRWGRLSMIIAIVLSFAPILYMYFIKGWRAESTAYVSVVIAIVSFGIGMWLTEPMSYFPILGSAGTYMSYFAGNVGNMRAPVALSVQSSLDTDVSTPKGNIATIIAIATSVYVNLIILFLIIIVGQQLLNMFPQAILDSFKYIIPAIYGSLIVMRARRNPKLAIKYVIPALIIYFIVRQFAAIRTFRLAFVMAGTILYGYTNHKIKNKA